MLPSNNLILTEVAEDAVSSSRADVYQLEHILVIEVTHRQMGLGDQVIVSTTSASLNFNNQGWVVVRISDDPITIQP